MILFWGNSQMIAPVYDIQKFKGNLDYSKMPSASLGHAEKNKDYQFKDNRPWTERNSWLLQVILVAVAAVLYSTWEKQGVLKTTEGNVVPNSSIIH